MRERVQRNIRVEPNEVNLWNTLKQARYFYISMIALILSACVPVVEKQLLVLSLITGAKWIADGVDKKINILIKCNRSYLEGGD